MRDAMLNGGPRDGQAITVYGPPPEVRVPIIGDGSITEATYVLSDNPNRVTGEPLRYVYRR